MMDLKSNALGKYNISSKMLKLCLNVIASFSTYIVNCYLKNGHFLDIWKFSLVKPLPKVQYSTGL